MGCKIPWIREQDFSCGPLPRIIPTLLHRHKVRHIRQHGLEIRHAVEPNNGALRDNVRWGGVQHGLEIRHAVEPNNGALRDNVRWGAGQMMLVGEYNK